MWAKKLEKKWFRITHCHGQWYEDHDQEKSTSTSNNLDYGNIVEGGLTLRHSLFNEHWW